MSHTKRSSKGNSAVNSEPLIPEIALGEEELSDVSLATFPVFGKEDTARGQEGGRLARRRPGGCGCGHSKDDAIKLGARYGSGICEPTRDSLESQHKPRPKDQDAAGRHAKPV
jgi:hypothetical protein